MGRKFYYLVIFLLVSLFHLSTVRAADELFPYDGGKTKDGIEIKSVDLGKGFKKLKGKNTIQLKKNKNNATMTFYAIVPQGKVAELRYFVRLKLVSQKAGVPVRGQTHINFKVSVGQKIAINHDDPTRIYHTTDVVPIPSGTNLITITADFNSLDNKAVGSIDSLSIHIHDFSNVKIDREPLCEEDGSGHVKCNFCGKDSTITIPSAGGQHDLQIVDRKKFSCMSIGDSVKACQRCPYMEITTNGEPSAHDFKDGKCTVCGLLMPKSIDDGKVYEIHNASEMRVLSELVSIGEIPGNIGIDIKNDLVFSKEVPMFPLGTSDHPFQGVLNGNGHRISGIVGSYQGTDCLGFVGVAKGTLLSHAVIANLVFDSKNSLRGMACVGGIVGMATECDIINCASFGALEGSDYVGGIVGYAGPYVSLINCASVTTIRSRGTWNTMACGMPSCHIQNSYGASTNDRGGTFDELPTTTLRHCFSNLGTAEGLTYVSTNELSSYGMVQALNEECDPDKPIFHMSETDHYPIPVANSEIKAKTNRAIATDHRAYARRAAEAAARRSSEAPTSEPAKREVTVITGYVNENPPSKYHRTVEEVMREDSIEYPDHDRTYILARLAPKGSRMYEKINGGAPQAFQSIINKTDSTYLLTREYEIINSEKVKAKKELVGYFADGNERIDEYTIDDDIRTLTARVIFEKEYDIVYQQMIDGILKTSWSIETEYDDEGNATSTSGYSHNTKTGETNLEYIVYYTNKGNAVSADDDEIIKETYNEVYNNHVHAIEGIFTYTDAKDNIVSREHFIIDPVKEAILEHYTEEMVDGQLVKTSGIYFVYNENGLPEQAVIYGSADDQPGGEMQPHIVYEIYGEWQQNSFPTSIKVPTTQTPSMQKLADPNVYDVQGRVVRRVTDTSDPFSGLPAGLYIYQGNKYLKRK